MFSQMYDAVICFIDYLFSKSDVVVVLIGTAFGALLTLFIDFQKRRWFSGKLKASFANIRDLDYVARTQRPDAVWVRVLVTNTKKSSVARGCRAYLTGLTWRYEDGEPQKMPIGDSLPLKWSNTKELAVMDIPNGINQFVDIFRVGADCQNCIRPLTDPPKYDIPWRDGAQVSFEITIVSDERSPVIQRGSCSKRQGSNWDEIEITSNWPLTEFLVSK